MRNITSICTTFQYLFRHHLILLKGHFSFQGLQRFLDDLSMRIGKNYLLHLPRIRRLFPVPRNAHPTLRRLLLLADAIRHREILPPITLIMPTALIRRLLRTPLQSFRLGERPF